MKLHQHPDYHQRPCNGKPEVFDPLIDYEKPAPRVILDAVAMCGSCALQPLCWRENVTEPWVMMLRSPYARDILARDRVRVERETRLCGCGVPALKHKTQCAKCRKTKAAA